MELPVDLTAVGQVRMTGTTLRPLARGQFLDQLRLRTSPPAVPTGFVRRPRLAGLLTVGAAHPVTLISAGPGHGKTLTVASWARSGNAPGRVAWLTVDDTDNDLQAFWADVLGALAISGAVPPGSPLAEMAPAAGFGDQETRLVRTALAGLPGVVTLVLDDFHRIGGAEVLESFGQLLERQPPQLRLVVTTRVDPALRLHRLRVNGQVTDIRAADLAFNPAEAAELFEANNFHLSDAQLRGLFDRTRGWAAGLRMALMCLDPHDVDAGISRFTGSTPLVAEYLIEEVIDRLPPSNRQFLLNTSVADRISAALANELTGRRDGQLILERLAARHALVVALAGRNDWFSVHPLLREMLLHRLTTEQPDTAAELHLRASRWFAAQGEPIPAIRHATHAQAWDEVGRLTALAAPQLLTPNAAALVAALGPAAARVRVEPSTGTLLAAAVGHFHRHDYESMSRDVDDAAGLMRGVPPEYRPAAQIVIAVLQVVHARVRNPARIGRAVVDLLDLVDRTARRDLPTTEQYRVIARNNIALGQLWSGDLAEAEQTLRWVQPRSHELGLGLVELSTHAHLAVVDVIHGRLPDAHRVTGAAQEVANRRGWASEPQALGLYAAAALTRLEWDQLDAAQEQIDAGLTVSNSGSDVACRLVLAIAAVRVAVARRHPDAVHVAADRLHRVRAQAGDLSPFLARWCTVAHADACLATGDPQAAIEVIGAVPASDGGYPAALGRVTVAKARLLLRQPEAAGELLEPVIATIGPYLGLAVEARVLTAVAADQQGRDTAAITAITDAVELAQGAGMVGPFRAGGPRITALLARHRHVIARHLDFTAALTAANNTDTAATRTAPPPVEPLTEREHAVLRYLPTMFKSAEIAADLFVSVNTVKSQQQSIYRKLGVTTRRGAVDRARALNLLVCWTHSLPGTVSPRQPCHR
jgi:LuxR family maltose regulon positive regulatory protein